MEIQTTARNADLGDLVEMLRRQADVKYDVVVNAAALDYSDGDLLVHGGAAVVTDDGVTTADARLRPTDVFEDGVSEKLGIPRQYVRRMRESDELGLLDENVNTWLDRDARQFLVHGFRTDDPNESGIARSLLSDRFQAIDHLDILFGALEGVKKAGVEVEIQGADLSERMIRVNVTCPQIAALAPAVLRDRYRDPRDPTRTAREFPLVWSGFSIGNSETGGGAATLTPRIVWEVCTNGLTRPEDVVRKIHVGGQLDQGVVRWSDETLRKNVELVTAATADAVTTFLDVNYVEAFLAEIAEKAGAPVADAVPTIERIGKKLGYTKGEQDAILSSFIAGGDPTSGGILQAVTATAAAATDPDRAAALEDTALEALNLVAAV